MKTTIFFPIPLMLLVLLSFDFGASQQTIIYAQATFGRGPNCTGRGLCSLDEISQLIAGNNNSEIYLNDSGRICIEVNKSAISVTEAQQQFVRDSFYLDTPFDLPITITAPLLMPIGTQIAPGYYLVHEGISNFIIAF